MNASAAECVHGCGYGYINGALASAGLFDPSTNNGIWLAGDYTGEYPFFRIRSVNDDGSAQAATALALVRLFTLIVDGRLVSEMPSQQMSSLLGKAVAAHEVFIDRASDLDFAVTLTKVGLGPLKTGASVWSETSLITHQSGRKFVVAWQNFTATNQDGFDPIGHVVRDTIDAYLGV